MLVVSTQAGELEAGLARGGQTREHAMLAKGAGFESLVVAVSKMDGGAGAASGWSSLRYEEVRSEVSAVLRAAGFQDGQAVFVPVSALACENLGGGEAEACEACAGWYRGPTLLEALETASVPAREPRAPVRVAVAGREKRGGATVVSGRVEQVILYIILLYHIIFVCYILCYDIILFSIILCCRAPWRSERP